MIPKNVVYHRENLSRSNSTQTHTRRQTNTGTKLSSKMKGATVLILDRADDPFTPLMFHWTYEAMIHDLMRLSLKRVRIDSSKEELLLDSSTDSFYDTHRSRSFGVVADSLQKRNVVHSTQLMKNSNTHTHQTQVHRHIETSMPKRLTRAAAKSRVCHIFAIVWSVFRSSTRLDVTFRNILKY